MIKSEWAWCVELFIIILLWTTDGGRQHTILDIALTYKIISRIPFCYWSTAYFTKFFYMYLVHMHAELCNYNLLKSLFVHLFPATFKIFRIINNKHTIIRYGTSKSDTNLHINLPTPHAHAYCVAKILYLAFQGLASQHVPSWRFIE